MSTQSLMPERRSSPRHKSFEDFAARRARVVPIGGGARAVEMDVSHIKLGEGHVAMHILGGISLLTLKFSAALGAVFLAADFMGLPVQDPWFDFLVVYIVSRWAMASIVNGMPEPEYESSLWYIWCYRTMHSLAHISTAYFSHKNMWKYISGIRDGGE